MRRCGKPASLHGLTVPCMLKRGHDGDHRPSSKECEQAGMWISEGYVIAYYAHDQAKKILAKMRR